MIEAEPQRNKSEQVIPEDRELREFNTKNT